MTALLLLLGQFVAAGPEAKPVAYLAGVKGKIQLEGVRNGQKKAFPASSRMSLFAGDKFSLEDKSEMLILFNRGDKATIGSNAKATAKLTLTEDDLENPDGAPI